MAKADSVGSSPRREPYMMQPILFPIGRGGVGCNASVSWKTTPLLAATPHQSAPPTASPQGEASHSPPFVNRGTERSNPRTPRATPVRNPQPIPLPPRLLKFCSYVKTPQRAHACRFFVKKISIPRWGIFFVKYFSIVTLSFHFLIKKPCFWHNILLTKKALVWYTTVGHRTDGGRNDKEYKIVSPSGKCLSVFFDTYVHYIIWRYKQHENRMARL